LAANDLIGINSIELELIVAPRSRSAQEWVHFITTHYRDLPKTRLQHLTIAAAINIERLAAWLDSHPHAKTRISRFAALAT
jgi:hypothetical protein